MTRANAWRVAGVGWVLVILWLTLQPGPANHPVTLPWSCIICGQAGAADFLLNILLYLPLGVVARALGIRRWQVFAFAFALTAAVECAQWFLIPGRDGALGDVLANTFGAVIGWWILPGLRTAARPTRRHAQSAASLIFVVSSLIWWATGIGLRPAFNAAAPWVGQLQQHLPGEDAFAGQVADVEFNGIEVTNDPLARIPEATHIVTLRLTARLASPGRVGHAASMVRIVDAGGAAQVSALESGTDLVAELRMQATLWRLHTPKWAFGDAMRAAATEPRRISIVWSPSSVALLIRGGPAEPIVSQSYPLSAALGWVFVQPFVRTIHRGYQIWTALWIFGWFGALGWFAGAIDRNALALATVAAVGMLWVASMGTGTPWHPAELAWGAASCLLCGALARRRNLRLTDRRSPGD